LKKKRVKGKIWEPKTSFVRQMGRLTQGTFTPKRGVRREGGGVKAKPEKFERKKGLKCGR